MVEGESGILAVFPESQRPKYEPSKRQITFHTGAIAKAYSDEEPDQLRGPQHSDAWVDEIAACKHADETVSNLKMGLRLGRRPRALYTTTPRPLPFLRALIAKSQLIGGDGRPQKPTVAVTRGSTYANRANLPAEFIREVELAYGGTRLGLQELSGEILDDVDALFKQGWFVPIERAALPAMARTLVVIDPAISRGEHSDETGIIVVGLGVDRRGYVLADLSGRHSPDEWGRLAIKAFRDWKADQIIGETNRGGGDMVEFVLRTIFAELGSVPFKEVRATRGKDLRAEPVAALYEQKRVSHVVGLAKLEDQLITWNPRLTPKSPDRLDALVWGLTELMCHGELSFVGNLGTRKRRL